MTMVEYLSDDEYIEQYDRDVYGGQMPAHNKMLLRKFMVEQNREHNSDYAPYDWGNEP